MSFEQSVKINWEPLFYFNFFFLNSWNDIKDILERMNAEKIKPNQTTLAIILKYFHQAVRQKREQSPTECELALSTLAEFKNLGIEPSLACYMPLLEIFRVSKKKGIIIDVIDHLEKIQKLKGTLIYEMVSEECFDFFGEAMSYSRNVKHLKTRK